MSQPRILTLCALIAIAFGAGCRDAATPTQISGPNDPSKIILDGAHGGNKDFFFLPPMVPVPIGNPDFELGKFNNTLRPAIRVDICELKAEWLNPQGLPTDKTGCVAGNPIKSFPAGTVNLVNLPLQQNGWWTLFKLPPDGFYYVLWDTRQSNLNVNKYYRIKVFIDGAADPLGVADVDPMSSILQWKYTLTGQVIQLVDDVMLPITFRIEKGGGSVLCGDATACTSAVVSNTNPGGSLTLTVDPGGGAIAGATFPDGWLPTGPGRPQSVVVTIAKFDVGTTDPTTGAETKPCHLGLPLQQFPGCFTFSTTPALLPITPGSPAQFAKPVTAAVCYSLYGGDDRREPFAEMYASGPNEPAHALDDASDVGILAPDARDCTPPPVITMAPSTGVTGLARATWGRVKSGVGALFGVKTAYAVDLGLGGFMTAFSNVGPAVTATMAAVGSVDDTLRGGGATLQKFVRLTGSSTHTQGHAGATGIPDLGVHFTVDGTNSEAIAGIGDEVGGLTSLNVNTNALTQDESATSGGGYAGVNWEVPDNPGVYHLHISGPAFGGPVTFTVTVVPAPIDLGVLAGDDYSAAFAVNSSAQIVGYGGTNAGPSHALLWQNGQIVALNLPTDQGGSSRATGINDAGVIVGEMTINGQTHAFRWENGVTTDLGAPTWAASSRAAGINTAGTIVGWNNIVAGGEAHAWSWNIGGPITDLGVLPAAVSGAFAINDAGQIVGNSGVEFDANPWLRQPNGVVTFLGSLGGARSAAQAINASGTVVGESDIAVETLHPFRWSNGVMTDLGTLGGTVGSAFGIDDSGRIVGTANILTGENHAFLWVNGKMTDLGTLTGPRSSATAIKGSIVVGNSATASGFIHATRWNVGS